MIRILHVVKNMNIGGAETMIMNFYRKIDKNKIQFDFLCMTEEKGNYDDEIYKLGGRIFRVPSPNKGRIKNLNSIYKLLKKEKFDGIHSHVSFYSGYILLVSKLVKIKLRICHSHTTNDTRKINIIRYIYNHFSKFLIKIFATVKLSCGDKAGKYLYGNNNYEIINNGIDLDSYNRISEVEIKKFKEQLGIPKDYLVIGHVGRFEKVKNHSYFINFAKELAKYNDKFKIVLVGDGTEKDIIFNSIKSNNLEDKFVFTGFRSDINFFMKSFDLFVMPSLYEGFPLVIVEALAGGNICYLSNKISSETNIIDGMVYYFDINDALYELVNNIINTNYNKSLDTIPLLREKGYSINDTVKRITQIYTS